MEEHAPDIPPDDSDSGDGQPSPDAGSGQRIAELEAALLLAEEEHRALLDVLPIGIFIAEDARGERARTNRAGLEMLGLDPASPPQVAVSWAGPPSYRVFREGLELSPDDLPLRRAMRQGSPVRDVELDVERADGTVARLLGYAVPLFDEAGAVRGGVSAFVDITARKEAEARLRAQESLARLGEMTAVVAHEVKNPLAAISGALQVLAARAGEGSAERRIFASVQGRLQELSETVQELLAFARPLAPVPRRVPLVPLLEECAQILAKNPHFLGVQVRVEGASPQIQVDPEQLQEAVLNLLRNAAQAMDGQGVVRVEVRAEGAGWAVAVTDEGPGIPLGDQPRLFQPFFTTRVHGTGLGLAVVKRNLEVMGGRVTFASPPGQGATFSLWLPA